MSLWILSGRYQLQEVLGEGGMGVVYRATDLHLGRTVAIKRLRGEFAGRPEFVERFQGEARAAARLSHPNIVAVYDVGMGSLDVAGEEAGPYIVMEYLEGGDLAGLLEARGPLSPEQVVSLGSQLASALEYAHRRGLVHRDIKPRNILISREGIPKVVDFGVALAPGEGEDDLVGSAPYMAPEQLRGQGASPSSDIYSAGVVLYELATGRPPFRGESAEAVARMQLEDPVPRPSAINPALPPGLEAVILRALAKDPGRRFPSAGEMGRALQDYQSQGVERTQPFRTIGTPEEEIERTTVLAPRQTRARGSGSRSSSPWPWLVAALLFAGAFGMLALAISNLNGPGNVQAGSPPSQTVAGARATPSAVAGIGPPSTPVPAPSAVAPTPAPAQAAATAPPSPTAPAPSAVPTNRPPATPTSAAPQQTGQSPALRAAIARVQRAGYTVNDPSSYNESEQLRVLIGTAADSADGYDQRAFFFLEESYLGTDLATPSAKMRFLRQEGNDVYIEYSLYRPQDPMANPTGGTSVVRYHWRGDRLIPLDPYPTDDPSAPLSRR